MYKEFRFFVLSVLSFSGIVSAQKIPYSFSHKLNGVVPEVVLPARDFVKDIADAIAFEEAGNYPIFAHNFDLDLSLENSGLWTTLDNGDRIWRLRLKSKGALSTAFFFDTFYLPQGSALHVYSSTGSDFHSYGYENNQGNELFSTEFLKSDEQTIEYYEPAQVKGQGKMRITAMAHQFRDFKLSGSCEVNIVCSPEGDNWTDQKKGVCRILVVAGSSTGYCTGTLVNNTALDCKRYILTAWHCGEISTAADLNKWVFRFNYEGTTCLSSNTDGITTNQFTGCTKISDSNDNGGDTGSDFLLLEMSATSSPAWWPATAYYNGWTTLNATPSGGGVGIHHPTGSNKKISHFSNTPTSVSYGGKTPDTHWNIFWVATTNGHGVTEGGSSGSAVYNSGGLIFGTLTGGDSDCLAGINLSDQYGKMSYHWASNGTTPDRQLKPWLDPGNTGAVTLGGAYLPCNTTSVQEQTTRPVLNIFPNPSAGVFVITANTSLPENTTLRIINIMGEEIFDMKMRALSSANYTFDLRNQAAGLYFIQLAASNIISSQIINIVK